MGLTPVSHVCVRFCISCSAVFHYLCVFSGIYHARGANQRIHSCFLLPSPHFLYIILCETVVGGVDWCLLFGGFRKVQARSSWFGYKTDIYRFYLLFFSHLVWFSLFSTRSLSGDVYCGVEAGLLQGYNVVCCCWGISFCCCWVSKSVSVVCFLVLYVVSGVISCVARNRIQGLVGGK